MECIPQATHIFFLYAQARSFTVCACVNVCLYLSLYVGCSCAVLSLSLSSVPQNLLHRIFFRINSMWWQQLDSSYEATESFYVSPKPFCVRFKRTPIQYRVIHHFTFRHSYILTFSSCECLCFCIAAYTHTHIAVLVHSERVHCWIFECLVIISSKCYMKRLRNVKITRIKHTHTHTICTCLYSDYVDIWFSLCTAYTLP